MSIKKINAALVTAYQSAYPSVPTAYEGVAFTPPNGKWAQVFNLLSAADPVTLGKGGEDEVSGVFQIDINVPEGSGTSTLLTDMDTLKSSFVAGKWLAYQGQNVLIRKADPSAIRRIDGWLRISLSVYYTSRQTRGTI